MVSTAEEIPEDLEFNEDHFLTKDLTIESYEDIVDHRDDFFNWDDDKTIRQKYITYISATLGITVVIIILFIVCCLFMVHAAYKKRRKIKELGRKSLKRLTMIGRKTFQKKNSL